MTAIAIRIKTGLLLVDKRKDNMDRMTLKDSIQVIIFCIIVIVFVFMGFRVMDTHVRSLCDREGELMGYPARYELMLGCYVMTSPDHWVNLDDVVECIK